MTREQACFRFVVFYEAVALASGGKLPPWTHYLMKLPAGGRTVVSVAAGVWMLRHLEVEPRFPRGRVLP